MITGQDLHEQLTWHWEAQLRPRLEGLTDDELLWEPVADCWTVRDGALEGSWPAPQPSPVTTIGWRLGHIAMVFHDRHAAHLGDRTWLTSYPSTAAEALALVDASYAAWTAGVLAAPPERFLRAHQGPPNTADQYYPFWAVVLHVNREVIHHGAEVALLRDLYLRQDKP